MRWDTSVTPALPEDAGIAPALATSWTKSFDRVTGEYTITFNLRRGVTFHDGTPWNAKAAELNFGHVMGGTAKTLSAFHDWMALSVRMLRWAAVDTYTFAVTFDGEYEPALRELCLIRPFRMISPSVLPDIFNGELSCGRWFNNSFAGARVWTYGGVTYRCATAAAAVVSSPSAPRAERTLFSTQPQTKLSDCSPRAAQPPAASCLELAGAAASARPSARARTWLPASSSQTAVG